MRYERAQPIARIAADTSRQATISFGQAMPEREMRRAEQLTLDCDLFSRSRFVPGGLAGCRIPLCLPRKTALVW